MTANTFWSSVPPSGPGTRAASSCDDMASAYVQTFQAAGPAEPHPQLRECMRGPRTRETDLPTGASLWPAQSAPSNPKRRAPGDCSAVCLGWRHGNERGALSWVDRPADRLADGVQ